MLFIYVHQYIIWHFFLLLRGLPILYMRERSSLMGASIPDGFRLKISRLN